VFCAKAGKPKSAIYTCKTGRSNRNGATKIDFRGTPLMPAAHGEAKAESKQGYIESEVEFRNMESATRFCPEFLA
jgi:hypothetical protein